MFFEHPYNEPDAHAEHNRSISELYGALQALAGRPARIPGGNVPRAIYVPERTGFARSGGGQLVVSPEVSVQRKGRLWVVQGVIATVSLDHVAATAEVVGVDEDVLTVRRGQPVHYSSEALASSLDRALLSLSPDYAIATRAPTRTQSI